MAITLEFLKMSHDHCLRRTSFQLDPISKDKSILDIKVYKYDMNKKCDMKRAFSSKVESHLEHENVEVEEGEVHVILVILVLYRAHDW